MQYRKKPVIVEAFQLTEELAIKNIIDGEPLPFGLSSLSGHWNKNERKVFDAYKGIETLEGRVIARIGDYIIKGIKGELYPCKADIFEATYEKVEHPKPSEAE